MNKPVSQLANPDLMTQIQRQANQCVKCGLCAPKCPTYIKTQHEAESPRGRIALMEGLAHGKLALTEQLTQHLDHCLTCRACEAACPSEVQYGKLINNTRALLAQNRPSIFSNTTFLRLLNAAIFHPTLLKCAGYLCYLYQRLGMQWLLRKFGLLKLFKCKRLDAYIPRITFPIRWNNYYPSQQPSQGDVALFTGCISNLFDQQTLAASIKVLTSCGYGVHIPPQQCCGALHLHAGHPDLAWQLAKTNITAFNNLTVDAILTTASGCGAVLKEYNTKTPTLPNTTPGAELFSQKIVDINHFLQQINLPKQVQFKPLPKRIALHTPCTLRNVLHAETNPFALLSNIPELEIIPLRTARVCCGAAGLNMIQHPEMADALLTDILNELATIKPDLVVTTNIGCSLHLMKGLREFHDTSLSVLHPIQLLAQQLK